MKHTQGPYRYDETWAIVYGANGAELAACHSNKADAAFIVRACNAHDDLVAALDALLSDIDYSLHEIPPGAIGKIHIRNGREALAKAKGEA